MERSVWLDTAARAEEVRVVLHSEEGETRTPIWIVTVGPSAFVRSYRATRGKWYQQVIASPAFTLEIEGDDVLVSPTPVEDAGTVAAVSDAYRDKYADAAETPDMVTPEVAATTLRLEPLGS